MIHLNTYKHINSLADLFQDEIEGSISNLWDSYHTKASLQELKNKYLIELELPGYKKEDIVITVKDSQLNIGADNKSRGKRLKKVALPKDVDESKLKAKLESGILTISLYKKEECKPREIKVE